MTMHLGVFAEDLVPAATLVNVAAINDELITTNGDDMRVPIQLPFLAGMAALISATVPAQAQFQSPSLRQVANVDVEPVALGLTFGDPVEVSMHPMNPLPLRGDESLNFLVNTTASPAEFHYGLAWFSDGPQQQVNGNMFSVRSTMSVTADEANWVNGALTFGQDLPVGNYDVVGMRVRAAGLVAARLRFIGGAWAPGVPGVLTMGHNASEFFRFGRMGVWGSFHTNTPPSIDILAATGAVTPVVILDLIARQ